MGQTPARRTTATKTRPAKPEIPETDIEVLEHDLDAGVIEVKIFGEEVFTLSDDVNSFLLIQASGGTNTDFLTLLQSLVIAVEPAEKLTIEQTAAAEWRRFAACLGRQSKLTSERLMRLVNDITEEAGKESTGSSGS